MDCFDVLMEHTVTVKSPSVSRDSGGGTQISYGTRQSGVACLIRSPDDTAQELFGQEQLVGRYTVATFYTSTQRGDELTVTAGPTLVGVSMRVVGIKSQPEVSFLGFDSLVHLTCERVV